VAEFKALSEQTESGLIQPRYCTGASTAGGQKSRLLGAGKQTQQRHPWVLANIQPMHAASR
jgi:hypothetical protein